MIKGILKFAASTLMQQWLSSDPRSPSPAAVMPRPNLPLIRALLARYAVLGGLAFMHLLLFVSGIVVAIVAVAQSFENGHQFQAGPVFWTGLIMAVSAFLVLIGSLWLALSIPVSLEDLVVTEPVVESPPAFEPASLVARYLKPALAGIIAGWTAGRARADANIMDYPGRRSG